MMVAGAWFLGFCGGVVMGIGVGVGCGGMVMRAGASLG